MRKTALSTVLFIAAAGTAACSFHARAPEKYRDDTRAVLETRNPQIKQCYDQALQQDSTAQGTVAVRFTVENKTGNIIETRVEPAGTNAPDQLSQCVVSALQGLALDPPDQRDGLATFVYEFRINPPPPAS